MKFLEQLFVYGYEIMILCGLCFVAIYIWLNRKQSKQEKDGFLHTPKSEIVYSAEEFAKKEHLDDRKF